MSQRVDEFGRVEISSHSPDISSAASDALRDIETYFGQGAARKVRERFGEFISTRPVPKGADDVLWRAINHPALTPAEAYAIFIAASRTLSDKELGPKNLVKAGWDANMIDGKTEEALGLFARAEKLRLSKDVKGELHLGRALSFRDLHRMPESRREFSLAKKIAAQEDGSHIRDIIASLEEPGHSMAPDADVHDTSPSTVRIVYWWLLVPVVGLASLGAWAMRRRIITRRAA